MFPAELFETYPLYKKHFAKFDNNHSRSPFPRISIYCESCRTERSHGATIHATDLGVNPVVMFPPLESDLQTKTRLITVYYSCLHCAAASVCFVIELNRELTWVRKLSQIPPLHVMKNRYLLKLIGAYDELYQKGLSCEIHGYGIGAFVYYRRIVELIIDRLINLISEVFTEEDKVKYRQVFDDIRKSTVADEKIKLVKDLLPNSLRPDGYNPLGALYSALSEGIHGRSDEDCLQSAQTIRFVLTYLVDQVNTNREISTEYVSAMKELLEHRARQKEKKREHSE